MAEGKIKRAQPVAPPKDLDEAIKRFKNEAEISGNVRETDTIQRTYYIKVKNWLYLKQLSTNQAFIKGEKVNLNDLVNEALQLLFKKYGMQIEEVPGNEPDSGH